MSGLAIDTVAAGRAAHVWADWGNELNRAQLDLREHTARLQLLSDIDARLDRAIAAGDGESYMQNNHAFHFTLYNAQPGRTMTQLIETLWLQFGPFMRVVYERLSKAPLNDQHQAAIAAITAKDGAALRAAIAADIGDGMGLIGKAMLSNGRAP